MATQEGLELQLEDDLRSLGARLEDDRLCAELYRALTRARVHRFDRDGAVSLDFARAEELIDGLREERAQPRLRLAQTGDEGELAGRGEAALAELGWRVEPLDTASRDETHRGRRGFQPDTPPRRTLAEDHREAEGPPPVPRQGTPGRR